MKKVQRVPFSVLLNKKALIQVTYDLLDVPNQLETEPDSEEEEQKPVETNLIPQKPLPPKLTPVISLGGGLIKPVSVPQKPVSVPQPVPPAPMSVKKGLTRERAINPAPRASTFEPDWYDRISEVEFALALGDLVDDLKAQDKKAIMFWTRTSGNTTRGTQKVLPQPGELVELVDIRQNKPAGYGKVQGRMLSRGRVMGYLIISPLFWDQEMPFYIQ